MYLEQLKLLGHLPDVELKDLRSDKAMALITTRDRDIVNNRRCGHPDAYDAEIVEASVEDLVVYAGLPDTITARHYQEAHERFGKYSNQRWPKNCHPEYPGEYAIKVFIDWDKWPEHNLYPLQDDEINKMVACKVWGSREFLFDSFLGKPMSKVAVWMVFECYRWLGANHYEVNDGVNGSEHQIHITPKNIPGPTIGIGWFPSGQCSDHVNQHIDIIRFDLMDMADLLGHELGHNHGEEHQFTNQDKHGGVMSYRDPKTGLFYGFCMGVAPWPSWLPKDPSLKSLLQKYEGTGMPGQPEPPSPPEPPEPPQPPEPPVDTLFELLMQIFSEYIRDCINNRGRSKEQVARDIMEGSLAVNWSINRAVRKAGREEGLSLHERNAKVREIKELRAGMALDDVNGMIEDALASA